VTDKKEWITDKVRLGETNEQGFRTVYLGEEIIGFFHPDPSGQLCLITYLKSKGLIYVSQNLKT